MSNHTHPFDDSEFVGPQCAATSANIQRALDGEPVDLDNDPHTTVCPACRERVRAMRAMLAALAVREPVAVPSGFTNRVLGAVKADRRARVRRRVFAFAGGLAAAAAILVAVFIFANKNSEQKPNVPGPEIVHQPPVIAPQPREKQPEPEPAPEPRPVRIGDQFAKAGETLLEAPKPLTDSVAVAPRIFDMLSGVFTFPAAPDPMGNALEPARKTLVELPTVARTGLEPVTDTAEKAFNKFLRDMGAVKPNS